MKRVTRLSSLLAAALMTHGVQAETEISGFVTAGATYGDSEVSSYDGTFENKTNAAALNRLGIQISADVNPRVSVTGQLLARGNDPAGRYNVNADWAFVTYKATDAASVRVGKLKLTSYLISDYYEVGYAYPWVRPPQEVYSTNPITAIDGVDALVRFNFGNNSLLLQPYAGSGRDIYAVQPQETMRTFAQWVAYFTGLGVNPAEAAVFAQGQAQTGDINYIQFTTENMGGINVALTNPYFTVRTGHFSTRVYQADFGLTGDKGTYTIRVAEPEGILLYPWLSFWPGPGALYPCQPGGQR
jgi:hypothetical protein